MGKEKKKPFFISQDGIKKKCNKDITVVENHLLTLLLMKKKMSIYFRKMYIKNRTMQVYDNVNNLLLGNITYLNTVKISLVKYKRETAVPVGY